MLFVRSLLMYSRSQNKYASVLGEDTILLKNYFYFRTFNTTMDKLKQVLGGRENEEETGIIGTVSKTFDLPLSFCKWQSVIRNAQPSYFIVFNVFLDKRSQYLELGHTNQGICHLFRGGNPFYTSCFVCFIPEQGIGRFCSILYHRKYFVNYEYMFFDGTYQANQEDVQFDALDCNLYYDCVVGAHISRCISGVQWKFQMLRLTE